MKRFFNYLIAVIACFAGVSSFAQTNAESFYYAGCSAMEAGLYKAALTNFTKSIELESRNADTYNRRGRTKWWLQDYNGAVADYDLAICLNPKCGGYYCNRGQAKFSLKMTREAIADYDMAVELDPTNATAYFNRGTLKFILLTNYVGAVTDFTKAIELHNDSQEEDIYFWRGNAKQELKDYVGAIADYRKSLELNSNSECSSYVRTNLDSALKEAH